MTLQQLEYIVALDTHRHFLRAAEACNVSQPTLSSLVQKLEEELDVCIFDRCSKPIAPTAIGQQIINQARVTLFHAKSLKQLVLSEREQNSGRLHLGIIPTVAPYILPKLFKEMHRRFPQIDLYVSEMHTSVIVEELRKAKIDMALLATPLNQSDLLEIPLYYEQFIAYISSTEALYDQEMVDAEQLPADRLWVLKEGHCMRGQIFNFCHNEASYSRVYEAGSIDTLVNIVDENGGCTIIPELHTPLLTEEQCKHIRLLKSPAPVREISIVVRHDFVRERIINSLVDSIKSVIPDTMLDKRLKKYAVRL